MNIVLYEPEMPANTGNIGRTCVATNTKLHLIEPLGFKLSEKHLVRAGLDYWDKLDRFNKNAKASPAKGFIWKPENVQREAAACRDIVDKYYNGLILGCLNPDEAIPKFNEELEKAGINTIINEKQRQLDVWLSKK